MIEADGLTNPFHWRRCVHVWAETATPRRCLTCRAIDHGPVTARPLRGSHAGYRMGEFAFPIQPAPPVSSSQCDQGHEMSAHRYVLANREVVRRVCWVCTEAKRQAKLMEPCDAGHVGNRFYPGYANARGIHCRDCETIRKRRYRAAAITRAYAEAANA